MFRYRDSSRTSVFRLASRRHRPRCARRRKKIRGILPSASSLIPTTGGRGNLPGCGNFLRNIREIFSKDPQSLFKSAPCMISLRYGESFVADVAGERERAMRSATLQPNNRDTRKLYARARAHTHTHTHTHTRVHTSRDYFYAKSFSARSEISFVRAGEMIRRRDA